MTLIQQQVQAVFPSLPEVIRDLITSEDFNDRIEAIATKHGLNEDQSSALIRITVRLLIGVIPPTQFVSSIIENTEIEREEAALVAQEINRDIFNPVKDALKEIHIAGKAPILPATAPVVTTQPASTAPVAPVAPPTPAIKFSVAQALGNTATTTPPATPQANMPQPHIGNIFEEKLGGAFRLSASGSGGQNAPTQVIPPPPQATTPQPLKADPYREAA